MTYNTTSVLPLRGRWSLISSRSSLTWKTRGQKSILSGIYIRTDRPTNRLVEQVLYFVLQKGTNNEAKYKTLVAGLDLNKAIEAASVVIHCDS